MPDPATRTGRYARQTLSGAWRYRGGGAARHLAPAARCQDRDGLSRLWPARFRTDLGREYRADAGGEEIRTRSRIPPRHLCDVVDPSLDPGIHPALVEPRQDRKSTRMNSSP